MSDFRTFHNAHAPDYGQDSTWEEKRFLDNFGLVRNILEANTRYQEQAMASGKEGVVRLPFRIIEDRSVKNIQIIRKCTAWDLNRAALRTVAVSALFPSPSEDIKVPLYIGNINRFQI